MAPMDRDGREGTRTWRRGRTTFRVLLGLVFVLVMVAGWRAAVAEDWRTASRASAGIAPLVTREAVVQVYAARAWSWRSVLGVHTWVAVKPTDAPAFEVYEVIGWRIWSGRPALARSDRAPDARWFGAVPWILVDLRGPGVDAVIDQVRDAVAGYPYATVYRTWPGPNSNTFTAWVGREVPALRLDLPPTAIGKDYVDGAQLVKAPSGTGYLLSLYGVLGVLAARDEGLEVNVLGLTFGLDPFDPALKLPALGRIGAAFPSRRL
jgi:Protein of unknown function (DUF3750)